MVRWSIGLAGALALVGPLNAVAKPIAFADGTTVMAEYGAGTMRDPLTAGFGRFQPVDPAVCLRTGLRALGWWLRAAQQSCTWPDFG